MQETWVWFLGWEDPLEKELLTHSSIHAWRISWTEEAGICSPWSHKELDITDDQAQHSLNVNLILPSPPKNLQKNIKNLGTMAQPSWHIKLNITHGIYTQVWFNDW